MPEAVNEETTRTIESLGNDYKFRGNKAAHLILREIIKFINGEN